MARTRPSAICAAVLLGGLLLGARCPGTPVALSPAGATADLVFNFKRALATDDAGVVHVVWHDDRKGAHQVFYRTLDGAGRPGPESVLSAGFVFGEHPSIAVVGDTVQVAFHAAGPGGQDIYLRTSHDRGQSFAAAVRVSTSGAAAMGSLAVAGSRVHIAWMDDAGPASEVMVRTSPDRGASFGGVQQLSDAPYESWVPTVEASGDAVTVAWIDYRDANEELYLRRSFDGGATFAPSQRLTHDAADSWAPSLVMDGAFTAIAWFDRRDSPVTDAEVELPLDVALAMLGLPADPSPPRDPNVYYLPLFEARVARKLDAIRTAAPAWVAAGGDPALLQAALDEFNLRLAAWTAGFSVFLRRSFDGGASFDAPRRLSTPPGPALRPSLALHGQDLHVAWFDGRHGAFDIFYRRSPDRGATFLPEFRLTDGASESLRPSIVAAAGRVELVWRDDRGGTPRILHRRVYVPGP